MLGLSSSTRVYHDSRSRGVSGRRLGEAWAWIESRGRGREHERGRLHMDDTQIRGNKATSGEWSLPIADEGARGDWRLYSYQTCLALGQRVVRREECLVNVVDGMVTRRAGWCGRRGMSIRWGRGGGEGETRGVTFRASFFICTSRRSGSSLVVRWSDRRRSEMLVSLLHAFLPEVPEGESRARGAVHAGARTVWKKVRGAEVTHQQWAFWAGPLPCPLHLGRPEPGGAGDASSALVSLTHHDVNSGARGGGGKTCAMKWAEGISQLRYPYYAALCSSTRGGNRASQI
jgi:hypothetical protein